MITTAISETRMLYSTAEAPRSSLALGRERSAITSPLAALKMSIPQTVTRSNAATTAKKGYFWCLGDKSYVCPSPL